MNRKKKRRRVEVNLRHGYDLWTEEKQIDGSQIRRRWKDDLDCVWRSWVPRFKGEKIRKYYLQLQSGWEKKKKTAMFGGVTAHSISLNAEYTYFLSFLVNYFFLTTFLVNCFKNVTRRKKYQNTNVYKHNMRMIYLFFLF